MLLATVTGSWFTLRHTDSSMRSELLQQTMMVASAINIEHVSSIKGDPSDIENPDYRRLKEQLANIESSDEKIRFVYLMNQNSEGKIIFLVDNESPDSEDYSAPGDIYSDPSPELIELFNSGENLVEGPIEDEWGTWISALVPISDSQGEDIIAVFGMDIDAGTWRQNVIVKTLFPVGMTVSSFLLLALLIILWRNRNIISASRKELFDLKNFNESIVQNAAEGIIVTDKSGKITYANPALQNMLGCSLEEMIGLNWFDFVPESMKERAQKADLDRSRGISERYELALQSNNGYAIPLQISASPRYDSQSGEYIGSLAVMTNISDLLDAERAIRKSEEKYRLIFECSPLGVLHFDNNGTITDCNDNFVEIIGSSFEALIGLNMLNLPDKSLVRAIKKALKGDIASYEDYYHSVTSDKVTPVRALFAPMRPVENTDNQTENHVTYEGIGIIEDITDRKEAEKKIRHMSFHDQLTDLYNRHYLEEELKRLDTKRQLPFSIIIADVNGLKLVNDTYGHQVGDRLLCKAAEIIRNNSRSEDIVARWGGDEFVILLPQTGRAEAIQICNRINEGCNSIFIKDFPLSIALGAATREDMSTSIDALVKEAEDVMYEQKLIESRSTKSAVLNTLLKTLAAKSFETETHTRNMQEVAKKIAKGLGLHDSEISRLILLITLHDIGKINIPEDILIKENPLTENEWEIMKKHPETGYRIAMATEEFAHVADDILSHHENYDGSGYPRGLKGEEIPILARITSVADAYEVMSNGRPYKKAMGLEDIKAEFRRCTGTQFDPQLVEILLKIIE